MTWSGLGEQDNSSELVPYSLYPFCSSGYIAAGVLKRPELLVIDGNTGGVNNFTGVEISDLNWRCLQHKEFI